MSYKPILYKLYLLNSLNFETIDMIRFTYIGYLMMYLMTSLIFGAVYRHSRNNSSEISHNLINYQILLVFGVFYGYSIFSEIVTDDLFHEILYPLSVLLLLCWMVAIHSRSIKNEIEQESNPNENENDNKNSKIPTTTTITKYKREMHILKNLRL